MEKAFGTFPSWMKAYPKHLRNAAWELIKARRSPNAAIPPKYDELIQLGVASQVPCKYCIYFHTGMAKMFGATNEEIQEAIASAAFTRHWSTVMHGAGLNFKAFKA